MIKIDSKYLFQLHDQSDDHNTRHYLRMTNSQKKKEIRQKEKERKKSNTFNKAETPPLVSQSSLKEKGKNEDNTLLRKIKK